MRLDGLVNISNLDFMLGTSTILVTTSVKPIILVNTHQFEVFVRLPLKGGLYHPNMRRSVLPDLVIRYIPNAAFDSLKT